MPNIEVTVNQTIQKTIVTEVSPNQVISVDTSPSTTYIASETAKTVEIGNAQPDLTTYVKHAQTGVLLGSGTAFDLYYPRTNPSGFASGIDSSSLVSKTTFNDFTGKFVRFVSGLSSGIQSQTINYPFVFSSVPVIICEFENNQDNYIYNHAISSVNMTGFNINFSDILSSTGYKLHVEIQLI